MDYFSSPDTLNRTAFGSTARAMGFMLKMKAWNVRVHRDGRSVYLGRVHETSEALARCAALSQYGISEEEAERGAPRAGIYPDDDFDVSLA